MLRRLRLPGRLVCVALLLTACVAPPPAADPPITAQAKRNVIIILSDDHRYDFMGFIDRAPAFLETPNMDRMAAGVPTCATRSSPRRSARRAARRY